MPVFTEGAATTKSSNLLDVYELLKTKRWVDLTHSFAPGIPHWHGFPDEERETLYYYDEGVGSVGSGIWIHRYSHVGQWGTHADAPAHFVRGTRTLDQIDVKEMFLPLVVIDIHEKAAKKADYAVAMDDIRVWESKHGKVPEGCFVALRTDWSKRWPDPHAMLNQDSTGEHFPGWSMPVLKYLFEERKITACGHETSDNAPGVLDPDMAMERYVLSTNHYQIELLASLDQVPEFGALIVAAFPKPKNGSGFPARVFAILP
ncbi:MAG: cyclase family protein [Candidatus Bathyarchaeia archaeon]